MNCYETNCSRPVSTKINKLFDIRYKQRKKSDLLVEEKLKRFMYNFGEEFVQKFLKRYPNLVPTELNAFIKQIKQCENKNYNKIFMRKNN